MSDGGTNGDDGGRGGRDGGQRSARDSDGRGQNSSPSTAEKVLTAISIAFTVLLFGYVAWQAVQPPEGAHPQASVVGIEQSPNGDVLVRVELANPGDEGLISATVVASCSRSPPTATFDYVPAGGRERGVLVCPPGTTRPNVSVKSWVPT